MIDFDFSSLPYRKRKIIINFIRLEVYLDISRKLLNYLKKCRKKFIKKYYLFIKVNNSRLIINFVVSTKIRYDKINKKINKSRYFFGQLFLNQFCLKLKNNISTILSIYIISLVSFMSHIQIILKNTRVIKNIQTNKIILGRFCHLKIKYI